MKNLVIAVSPDSSLQLLGAFADIIVLDKEPVPENIAIYDTLYIRSHFAQPATLPQVFQKEIEDIVQRAMLVNPKIKFIDGTDTVEKILSAEDKWLQYQLFSTFMPRTQLFSNESVVDSFKRPVYKNRLSSRGNGVTWDKNHADVKTGSWIIQESLDITEELRIYVIRGEVYLVSTIRQSKTSGQDTQAVDYRNLTREETDFSKLVADQAQGMDIVGLDVARASDGKLYLLEVNRSPGFGMFYSLTGTNLASFIYSDKT